MFFLLGEVAVPKTKNDAVRTITKSYITDHTEPRMKKLELLKLDDLYKTECMLLIHDSVHGNAPSNIKSSIKLTSINLRCIIVFIEY